MQKKIASVYFVRDSAKRIAIPVGIRSVDADRFDTTAHLVCFDHRIKVPLIKVDPLEIWTNKKVTEFSAFTTTRAAFQGRSHNRW